MTRRLIYRLDSWKSSCVAADSSSVPLPCFHNIGGVATQSHATGAHDGNVGVSCGVQDAAWRPDVTITDKNKNVLIAIQLLLLYTHLNGQITRLQ